MDGRSAVVPGRPEALGGRAPRCEINAHGWLARLWCLRGLGVLTAFCILTALGAKPPCALGGDRGGSTRTDAEPAAGALQAGAARARSRTRARMR